MPVSASWAPSSSISAARSAMPPSLSPPPPSCSCSCSSVRSSRPDEPASAPPSPARAPSSTISAARSSAPPSPPSASSSPRESSRSCSSASTPPPSSSASWFPNNPPADPHRSCQVSPRHSQPQAGSVAEGQRHPSPPTKSASHRSPDWVDGPGQSSQEGGAAPPRTRSWPRAASRSVSSL